MISSALGFAVQTAHPKKPNKKKTKQSKAKQNQTRLLQNGLSRNSVKHFSAEEIFDSLFKKKKT